MRASTVSCPDLSKLVSSWRTKSSRSATDGVVPPILGRTASGSVILTSTTTSSPATSTTHKKYCTPFPQTAETQYKLKNMRAFYAFMARSTSKYRKLHKVENCGKSGQKCQQSERCSGVRRCRRRRRHGGEGWRRQACSPRDTLTMIISKIKKVC